MRRRNCGSGVASTPPSRTLPTLGRSSAAIKRSSVVFPEPLGPKSAVVVPLAKVSPGTSSTRLPARSNRSPSTATSMLSAVAALLKGSEQRVHGEGEREQDDAQRERLRHLAPAGRRDDRGREDPSGAL